MDYATYEVEAETEATHWWFVGRRWLFGNVIKKAGIDKNARTLDIGTSTGTNLRMLRDLGFSDVRGLDLHEVAIRWCEDKGLGQVELGDVCNMPYKDNVYQLVLATDIIEHVDDDLRALSEIKRILANNGYALVTVPAFQVLWGTQDDVAHHKRRYIKNEFITKLKDAGLKVEKVFYFNYLLFFPIWLARVIIRIFKINIKSEGEINSPIFNKLLTQIFYFDVFTADKLRPPFGVSLLALVKK